VTPTPIFRSGDRQAGLEFMAAYPFAMIAVNGASGPVLAMVPLVINSERTHILGHVARANPFWKAAQSESAAMAVFRGPDAYVSPAYYPSKQQHGRVVPTWNYMALELRGQITLETRPDFMLPFIKALTDKMENHREVPWEVSDAPADYIAKLSRAIIGFSISIDEIHYIKKLSQNKSVADTSGVRAAFQISENPQERILAEKMALEINRPSQKEN